MDADENKVNQKMNDAEAGSTAQKSALHSWQNPANAKKSKQIDKK